MPTLAIPVSPDGAWYSGLAYNIYHGRGLVDLNGTALYTRPLLPALIAMAYGLLGPEPSSAFVVVQNFFLINILAVSLIAKNLYGKWVGLIAGLIVVSTYTLQEWSTWVNLDLVLPAFILLFLYFGYLGMTRQKNGYLIMSGVCLALGFLVKETAIFFLPLPFLYVLTIPEYRQQRTYWHCILWIWSAFIITLLPWFLYTTYNTQNPLAMLGRSPFWASSKLITQVIQPDQIRSSQSQLSSMMSTVWRLLHSFSDFYQWHIAANFTIAPFLALSSGIVILTAFFGNHSSRYLACALVLYTPMIILQGTVGFRTRQSVILIFLLIIATAYSALLPMRLKFFRQRTRWQRFLPLLTTTLFLIALIIRQSEWQTPQKWLGHLRQFNTIAALQQPKSLQELPIRAPQPWWPASDIVIAATDFAEWTEQNEWQPDRRILSHGTSIIRYANLVTKGQHHFTLLRWATEFDEGAQNDIVQVNLQRPNPVQLDNGTHREVAQGTILRIHTQQSILSAIIENKIDYVITGHPEKWLATYFISHPDFIKVADFEYGTMQLFQVLSDRPRTISLPPSIDRQLPTWLNELAKLQPSRYQEIHTDLFTNTFGWTQAEIETGIMAEPKDLYHANSFLYRHYASWVIENWDYDAAISIQQGKAASDPANPWPHVTLGALYQEQGKRLQSRPLLEASVAAYTDALTIAPDNWWSAWAVTQMNKDDPTLIDESLLTKALNTYEQIVVSHPQNPQSYNRLAHIYRQLQRHEDAIHLYQDALRLGVVNQDIYYGLGRTYEMVGKVEEAIHVYKIGLREAPVETQGYMKIVKRLDEIIEP